MINKKTLILGIGFMFVGLFLGWYFFSPSHPSTEANLAATERKVLYWVAPMDPNFKSDTPGKSPMGMDLIPVYSDTANDNKNMVIIAPEIVQNLGVRTAFVKRGEISRNIETVGFVGVDENLTSHIHVRASGWIVDLKIKAEGERVKKGDLLFRFYSPEIANAKSELVQALRMGNSILINASKQRLLALDVAATQVQQIITKGSSIDLVDVFAPQDGIIIGLNVAEGMRIEPGTTIFSLADLRTIWLNAEVFEDAAPWLKTGALARVKVPFMPKREWHGKVDYIYPTLDPKTRTIRARIVLDNANEDLKPNMYSTVSIVAEKITNALKIPREALITTGSSSHVIEALGEGRFRPVEVVVGISNGQETEVLSGLNEGMKVVTSGQFLIDSEASLFAGFERLSPLQESEGASPKTMDKPGKMDMSKPMDMSEKKDTMSQAPKSHGDHP